MTFNIPTLEDSIDRMVLAHTRTGSSYTCDPPVLNTDDDHVLLVRCRMDFARAAEAYGWESTARDYEGSTKDYISYRRGRVNLIVGDSPEAFDRWKLATFVAKRLNLLRKEDRKVLFDAILFGREREAR